MFYLLPVMKIISNFVKPVLPILPQGKLSARWVNSRATMQVYLSGKYLYGVDGETEEICIRELNSHFKVQEGREIDFQW